MYGSGPCSLCHASEGGCITFYTVRGGQVIFLSCENSPAPLVTNNDPSLITCSLSNNERHGTNPVNAQIFCALISSSSAVPRSPTNRDIAPTPESIVFFLINLSMAEKQYHNTLHYPTKLQATHYINAPIHQLCLKICHVYVPKRSVQGKVFF